MSRKLMEVCVAGALLVSALTSATQASANWTTNGNASGTAVALTAGPVTWAFDASGAGVQGFTCTISSLGGLVLGGSSAVNPALLTFTGMQFSGCNNFGSWAFKCAPSLFSAMVYQPATNIVSGRLQNIQCVLARVGGACGNPTTFAGGGVTVIGSLLATYGNTSQILTLQSDRTLSATWNSAGCMQGTGTGSTVTLHFAYGPAGSEIPQISN